MSDPNSISLHQFMPQNGDAQPAPTNGNGQSAPATPSLAALTQQHNFAPQQAPQQTQPSPQTQPAPPVAAQPAGTVPQPAPAGPHTAHAPPSPFAPPLNNPAPQPQPSQPQPQPQQSAPTPNPESPASQAQLRASLEKLGFDLDPSLQTDEQVANTVAQMIDEANAARDQLAALQKSNESSSPGAPAALAPDPAGSLPPSPGSFGSSAKLSDEAKLFQQHNLVTRGEDGTWVASNPRYQAAADEINHAETVRQATALQFMSDPEDFLRSKLESLSTSTSNAELTELKNTVSELQKQLTERANREAEDSVNGWVQENMPVLYQNGQPTEYANKYTAFESQARQFGITDRVKLHAATLQLMNTAGVTPTPPPQQAPAPAQPVAPGPSFMQKTAANAPFKHVNRLQEYAGQAPATQPQVPTTGAGLIPSLSGIIGANTNL